MTELPDRRLLLVHAHPDDESINNGATMARYAAEGAHVTLVTCTLGVQDFRLLGGAGRYSDSGMMGLPDNDDPACFWQADVDEAAAHLVEVIREVRPQVLVTYDDNGGYGHPDHIQAHRVAMRAAELSAEAGRPIPKVYWNRAPREDLPGLPFAKAADVGDVPGVVADERITTAVDGTAHAAAKAAAMRAHATQITVSGPYFVLSNELAQPILTTEYYELVRGERGSGEWETDLFAGVEEVS
jgi:N-acetyl-1-D-myo-inositol-2-amino-2-deoxy-alpha-D-glucopyranoside deacetylase